VELEQANGKLAEQVARDGLTGVANRRAMEQALTREWERCREAGESLAVVMADVDHFKQFNDLHGHQEGDAQLRRVAQALDDEVVVARELAARYGGEEFVLILPGLSVEMAAARAESVRRRAEQVTLAGGTPSTVSFGVAAWVPSHGAEPNELLRSADAALYRAKRGGRNRVEVAT
jgi:diguanylate cyclase (GGDEF)-like protein